MKILLCRNLYNCHNKCYTCIYYKDSDMKNCYGLIYNLIMNFIKKILSIMVRIKSFFDKHDIPF